MLPATAAGMIALFCQPGMASAWRSERRPDSHYHAGSAAASGGDGYDLMAALPGCWQPVPEWGDWPYLVGWRNDHERAVLTYCEGDLSVEVADTPDAYLRLLHRTSQQIPATPDDGAASTARLDAALTDRRQDGAAAGEGSV